MSTPLTESRLVKACEDGISTITRLQGERDKYKLLYESSQLALGCVLTEFSTGIFLYPDEVQILNKLLDGYTAVPSVQKVLNKLKGKTK